MAKELPEDLLIQILLCLPVVSLLRFKSVCKSWYALITRPSFVRKHLLHNNINSNTLLLYYKTTEDYVFSMLSYETLQVSSTASLPPPYFGVDKDMGILPVGSSNGLVCLDTYNGGVHIFVIWNPATKQTKVVPDSNLPPFTDGLCASIDAIAFGFDAKNNDYKIIKRLQLPHPVPDAYVYLTEVYSLRSDSWKEIDSLSCFFIQAGFRGTYHNGMASWRARTYFDPSNPISIEWQGVLSFDMSDEVFIKTTGPADVQNSGTFPMLLDFKGSIAMAIYIPDGSTADWFDIWHIWLLPEVGVGDSWTKLFTFGPLAAGLCPIGFWKNDTVFLEKCDGQLILYDPYTNERTNLQIGQGVTSCTSLRLVTYMETLVSVTGGNEFEE